MTIFNAVDARASAEIATATRRISAFAAELTAAIANNEARPADILRRHGAAVDASARLRVWRDAARWVEKAHLIADTRELAMDQLHAYALSNALGTRSTSSSPLTNIQEEAERLEWAEVVRLTRP